MRSCSSSLDRAKRVGVPVGRVGRKSESCLSTELDSYIQYNIYTLIMYKNSYIIDNQYENNLITTLKSIHYDATTTIGPKQAESSPSEPWSNGQSCDRQRAGHQSGDPVEDRCKSRVTDNLPYRLAPLYDMLPMLYAPGAQGDLGEPTFAPRPPVFEVEEVWGDAASAAQEFWGRASTEAGISKSFRSIARNNRAVVSRMLARFS